MIFFDDQGKAVGDIAGFYPPPTLISLIRDYAEMSTKNTKVKNLLKAETTD